ncbi:MAG: hypothetical protein AAYR33_04450 [Acetobacteraceae bacterium]
MVGTGAGGGPLIARLAEMGYSVVGFDAGAWFRPLEDFASDETSQSQLFWTDNRLVIGENPIAMGKNNSGKAVGGSTVHYAMVSLRFRPDWFLSRTKLGYGADWPIDWREMGVITILPSATSPFPAPHLSLGAAPPAISLSRA